MASPMAAEIMAVEGVDTAFLGPGDLGLSMGIPPERHGKDPRHLEAIARVLEAARSAGKPAGFPVGNSEAGRRAIEQGFLMIDLTGDFRLLQGAATRELAALRG